MTVGTVRAHPDLIGEENINGDEEQPNANCSSHCSVAQTLQESRVSRRTYTPVWVWVSTGRLKQVQTNKRRYIKKTAIGERDISSL